MDVPGIIAGTLGALDIDPTLYEMTTLLGFDGI